MAAPSLTYTFSNGSTADASEVMQNLNDLLNGITDGTKDLTFRNLTVNGTTTLGDNSSDDVTINGSIAASIPFKTQYSYDIGSATKGVRSVYFGSSDSAAKGTRVIGATVASDWTMTLPTGVPTESDSRFVGTTAGVASWVNRDMHEQNFIHNGAFDFWQRGTSFAAITTGKYLADRFCYRKDTTTAVHTVSQETSVLPTLAESGFKSSYALKVDCTTADAAVAADDYVIIRNSIEGYDWARLIGRQVTLSFWVYATKTGTYCVSFVNGGFDRSYVAEYTISSANTWEKKTITVTLNPSGGTEDYTNGMGLCINWALMGGSTYQTTAGSWQSGLFYATSNQVNACDDTANNFYLAQVMLNLGASAAPMARAGGTLAGELALCQRYCLGITVNQDTPASKYAGGAANSYQGFFHFPTRMRAAPTLSNISSCAFVSGGAAGTNQYSFLNWYDGAYVTNVGAVTLSLGNSTVDSANIAATAATSLSGTAGVIATMRFGSSSFVVFDAEFS